MGEKKKIKLCESGAIIQRKRKGRKRRMKDQEGDSFSCVGV